ncbi:hypothetical protein [Caulobacter sp. FWC26]|uniref:hypothetical protein n=1 Tax=Caulobacter sp. FWC26 TaxID=69665 RepID=UPI000C15AA0C|nr:hypothetical protein [Caulobacter sp. FWC26]AZS20010.1 hypothetical protein CSW63_04720 [Caulobacter sp. FWC26]
MNDTTPDALFFIADHDVSLWSLPWVARAEVTPAEGGKEGEKQVKLWFRREANQEVVSSTLPPVPDRPHDLEAYNYGNAPPPVFWHIHPAFESYRLEYDNDDGAHWWARIWLKKT